MIYISSSVTAYVEPINYHLDSIKVIANSAVKHDRGDTVSYEASHFRLSYLRLRDNSSGNDAAHPGTLRPAFNYFFFFQFETATAILKLRRSIVKSIGIVAVRI